MTRTELFTQLEKLQHRWQYHAVEHRAKRDNNDPNYNAYDHGVATGYLKALNTFKDLVRRFESEKDLALTIADIEKLHTFLYAVKNNKQGAFTFTRLSDEQYEEVIQRFNKTKEQ